MVKKRIGGLLVALFLIFVWKLAWDYLELNPEPPVRMVGDIWDLRTYYNNGKWFPNSTQPYVDVPSEYPQVATYLFGAVHWFSRNELRAGGRREIYFHMFSLIMVGFAYLNYVLLSSMLGTDKRSALLLFLPGPLYYTLYRFDALPSFLCLLAVFFVRKRYWNLAAVLLGVATFTKWYPILLIPPLVTYFWSIERKLPWKPLASYLITCVVIITPTIMAGGVDALLSPYQFHFGRNIETASLPGYIEIITSGLLPESALIYLFLGLQVISSAISFFLVMETHEHLENWFAIIVSCFVVFSRIFSPQWILWVLPLLILASRNIIDILLIGVYGVLVYFSFPITYDAYPSILPLVNMIGLLPLLVLVVRYLMRVEWKFAYSSGFSVQGNG